MDETRYDIDHEDRESRNTKAFEEEALKAKAFEEEALKAEFTAIVVHEDRESPNTKAFEEEALKAKLTAILVGSLHTAMNFIHVLCLTWATVVLLGGFVSSLRRWDFFLVTCVLVSHSMRFLFVKAYFKRRSLLRRQDKENVLRTKVAIYVLVILWSFTFISYLLICLRVGRRGAHPLSHQKDNLFSSLLIFYILEMIVTWIDLAFCIAVVRKISHYVACMSLQHDDFHFWYFLRILQETIVHGALMANEMKISDLAVRKIAEDIEVGYHPLSVNKYYERLTHYMYDQPGAVDRVYEYLKSENLWIRAAASSMPGFWVTRNKITLEKELLWRLRERMYGGGRDAECAISSAKLLAAYWVEKSVNLGKEYPFLVDDPVAGTNIVDTLVNIVLQRIRPTLLFQVKALAACCRHHLVMDHFYQKFILEVSLNNGNSEDILKDKVGEILQELIVGATNQTPASGQISAATRTAAPGRRVNDNKEMKLDKQLILTSRLGQLCMKLYEIILPSNRSVQFVTKIYASEALLSLLLHDDTPILHGTRLQLQSVVKDIMPSQRKKNQTIELEDVESMERVRQLLSLEPFSEWKMFKVSGIDEGDDVFDDELSQQFVEMKVKDARESVAH